MAIFRPRRGEAARSLFLPALGIAEHDPEDAATAAARFVEQNSAVELAQLAGDEQPETGAALAAGEKRLEYAIHRLRFDSGAAVGDFQKRSVAWIQAAELDLDADPAAGLAILDGVIAQVPDHLMQVAGIEAHFQIFRFPLEADPVSGNLHGLAELAQELLDPVAEGEAGELGGFAAREL